jgi:hypothetical protein
VRFIDLDSLSFKDFVCNQFEVKPELLAYLAIGKCHGVYSVKSPDLPCALPRVLLDLVLHLPLAVHLAVLPVASVDLAVGEPADAITMFLAVLKFARVDPPVSIID